MIGQTVTVQNSVDVVMQNLALHLIRDFRSSFDDPTLFQDFELAIRTRDPKTIREATPTLDFSCDSSLFKATYQLHSVFKRHRFENDLYTDSELVTKAVDNFHATQSRLATIDLGDLPRETEKILNYAAKYIANLLGKYSDEEHRSLCRFGKKASVGIPARLACEAARWELPISGSQNQIAWFDSEMSQYECVQEYWATQKLVRETELYHVVDSLKLVLVPKSYKSLRSIMPNTTIGSYMSYGLGEMIRERLKERGYDIRYLQQRHRYLACRASVRNDFVTADLSSASDSISVALVQRLFPSDWFEILNLSRIGGVVLPDQSTIQSETFCTMGVGYTFPLQTLVFLALLKATEAILYNRQVSRTISVYGDDLIYHRNMHTAVVRTFERLGFVINLDKTFHDGEFRESCGGDYHRGVDVRPFQPEKGRAIAGLQAREATLYKFINGLLMRWSECEIRGTLCFLASEVEKLGPIKIVPGDFPDDAGVRCHTIDCWDFLQLFEVCKPKHIGHGVRRFSYLRFKNNLREESRHVPYYWVRLRNSPEPEFDYSSSGTVRLPVSRVAQLINELTNANKRAPLLIEQRGKSRSSSEKRTRRALLRQRLTCVTVRNTGRYVRQSGTSCFEDRR